jgi:hypothetical protein
MMSVRESSTIGPLLLVTAKSQGAKDLSPEQREELLRPLKARFEKNMNRHKGLEWDKLQSKAGS